MSSTPARLTGRCLVEGAAEGALLFADVGLSFWGGVDPLTGEVIDRHHPLSGECLAGRVLAIPSGRGSCTGSSVLMELISNGHAPAALVLADADEILTLGVLVAQMIFQRSLPVMCVGHEAFDGLRNQGFARVEGNRLSLAARHPEDGWQGANPGLPSSSPSTLELSTIDRALLDGTHGEAARMAMQIVLRMAEIQGATQLLDVTQAHIDGCIYTGPASLRFAEQLVSWGAKVRVPTTLNSISVDQRRWRELGVDPALGEPASALGDAYMAMGAQLSFTCAPYLLDTAPAAGEQIVWAESNAVVYANSVLGARTQKYPDFLDICIALCGRAPLAGCHLDDQRMAGLIIEVPAFSALDDSFWPLLGYHIGHLTGRRIPLIRGLEHAAPSLDDLKAFGAAFATTSAAPLFHIAGVTPEALEATDVLAPGVRLPHETVDAPGLLASWHELNSARHRHVDVVSLGNPHFSLSEFATLAALCAGRHKHPRVVFAITCGRAVLEQARAAGHLTAIEAFGATLVTDTCWCMLGEPVIPPQATTLMTNSGKYAHYAPGLVGRGVHFAALAECVQAACDATASGRLPTWLHAIAPQETPPMFDYSFQWRPALRALPDMLAGAWVTFETAALSMIFGVLIALVLTVMRQARHPLLRGLGNGWVSIARNTPSLFQIYILYFGLGSLGLHISSWLALLAGITFNNAGYLAENFRGGLKAVPGTQMRAARSLGMSAFQAYRMIIVPQLLRIVFYPLTNQMVWAVLMTSLGVVVGLNNDLTGVTQEYNVKTFRTFEYFALAAVLYYLIAKLIVGLARLLSWRLFRY